MTNKSLEEHAGASKAISTKESKGSTKPPRKPNSVEAVKVAMRMLDKMALARRAMRITELADMMGEIGRAHV